MNSLNTTVKPNNPPDEDAKDCARHFKAVVGFKQKTQGWIEQCRLLLDKQQLSPAELKEFMTWAATENQNEKPQFSSVDYLAKANNPMSTLVKHADSLLRVWSNSKRTAGVKRVSAKSMPLDMAEWMMLGPGVNQPVDGWESARQKMDKIKIAWYGKGGENQPDPMEAEHLEQLFARYQAGLGINMVGTND